MHTMHVRDLDLTQITLLAELTRLGSVSAAARRIGLSQSAASHALAKLRQQLGDPLFTRTRDGLKPTPYGERLGKSAAQALDLLAEGLAANDVFDPKTTTRQFTFYLSDVGQMVLLPPILGVVQNEAPGLTLRSVAAPLDDPAAPLISGEVDLAVGYFTNLTTGFHQTLLFRERFVCIVRVDHPAFQSGMTLEAFNEVRHAVSDAAGMAHGFVDQCLAKHRVSRKGTLRVPGFQVLPLIIANCDLLAFIPARLAASVAAHVPIRIFQPPVHIPPLDIRMFWHERYHHDPANRWMRRILLSLFGSENRRKGLPSMVGMPRPAEPLEPVQAAGEPEAVEEEAAE
jgi:molybdate transport repressor ModE-like protein